MDELIKQFNSDFDAKTAALSIIVGICQFLLYFTYAKCRGPKEHTPAGRKIISKLKQNSFHSWSPYTSTSFRLNKNTDTPSVICGLDGSVSLDSIPIDDVLNRKDRKSIRKEIDRIKTEKQHHALICHNDLVDGQLARL